MYLLVTRAFFAYQHALLLTTMAIQNNLKEAKAWLAAEKPQLPPSWLVDLLKKPVQPLAPFNFPLSASSATPLLRNGLSKIPQEKSQPQPLQTSTQALVLEDLSDFSDNEDLKLIDTTELGLPRLKRQATLDERLLKKQKAHIPEQNPRSASAENGLSSPQHSGSLLTNESHNTTKGSSHIAVSSMLANAQSASHSRNLYSAQKNTSLNILNHGSNFENNTPQTGSVHLQRGTASRNPSLQMLNAPFNGKPPVFTHQTSFTSNIQPLRKLTPQLSSLANDSNVALLQNYIRICESKIALLSKWNAINESTSLSLDAKNLWHTNNFLPQLQKIEASQHALRSSFSFLDPLPATQDLSKISTSSPNLSNLASGSILSPIHTTVPQSPSVEITEKRNEQNHVTDIRTSDDDMSGFLQIHHVTSPLNVMSPPAIPPEISVEATKTSTESEYKLNNAEARNFIMERRAAKPLPVSQTVIDDELEDDFGEQFMDGLHSSQVDDAATDLSGFLARDDEDLSSVDGTYMTQPMSQTKSDIDEVESDEPNDTKDDDLLDEMRDIVLSQDVAQRYGVKYDNVEPIEISDHEIEEENENENDDENMADFTTQLKEGHDEVVEITSEDEIPDADLNVLTELLQSRPLKIEVVSESDFSDDDQELIELSKSVGTNKPGEGKTIPPNSGHFIDEVYDVLHNVFKLPDFRPNQLEAVVAALNGKDVFVLIPTGGGKSLCYQLPALVKGGKTRGVTIVISPLISLMQDQVQHLRDRNINAAMISSRGTTEEKHAAIRELTSGQLDLVYLSPEMVNSSNMIQRVLSKLYESNMLARVVVDEAHCVSSWGHDFRPDYQGMSLFKEKFPEVPIMALTATANEKVRLDIVHHLRMKNLVLLKQSFNRTNLFYEVRNKPPNLYEWIRDYVMGKMAGKTGIIYCHSKQSCETTAQRLNDWGIKCMYYHAGMDPNERFDVQTQWQHNKIQLICATIAFGMGIDKPDVRFVIHMYIPKSLEGYYQETGRAGRDGKESECIMFYSYKDARALQSLIQRDRNLEESARESHLSKLRQVVQYCENKTDCRRKQVLHFFNESFDPANCARKCDNCCSDVVSVTRDVTEHCLNIVKMVQSLQADKVTVIHCQDVYKGSRGNKILKLGHHENPYHGKGRELDRGDMERIFFHLQSQDCLLEYQVMKGGFASTYVKLGPNANSVLSGRNRVQLSFAQNSRPSTGNSNRAPRLTALGNGSGIGHLRYQESFVSAREVRYEQEKENINVERSSSKITLEKHTFDGAVNASNEQAVEQAYHELRNLRLQKLEELGYGRPHFFMSDTLLKEMAVKLPTNARDFAKLQNISKDQVSHFQYFKRLLGTLSRERKRQSSQGDSATQHSTFTQANSTISEHASPYFQRLGPGSQARKKSQGRKQRRPAHRKQAETRKGTPSQVRQMPI